jgi:hypothetical protein
MEKQKWVLIFTITGEGKPDDNGSKKFDAENLEDARSQATEYIRENMEFAAKYISRKIKFVNCTLILEGENEEFSL